MGRSLGLSPSMPVFSLPERDAATADRSNRLLASVVCAHEPDKEEEAAAAEEEEAAAASSKAVSRIIGGRVGGRGKPKPRQVTGVDRELEQARAAREGRTRDATFDMYTPSKSFTKASPERRDRPAAFSAPHPPAATERTMEGGAGGASSPGGGGSRGESRGSARRGGERGGPRRPGTPSQWTSPLFIEAATECAGHVVSTHRPRTSPSLGCGHGGAQLGGALGGSVGFECMSDVHLFVKADTRPLQQGFAPRSLLEARPASAAVLNHPAASGHLNGFARFAPWG